ncbi:glutathione S-transferase family protein [Exilibacterium tricleocarpae]|uniref:Glutathione S-transferase family protein n=1 Tax=Exilibacterium tricleocarpae TaxID=2591008 RepID=A0A545TVJ5_9GAMM|nr:glutathione S-transferase family protein [Exilibacterium tricleocarpae]TQV81234.1 glutathione S-transferase family protein [Exilibacterium tricleocarpae]
MQLVNIDHSPYAARVRIQIRKKGLPITMTESPVPRKTPAFLQAFPLAKIPLLALDNGDHLPESVAIMEYLEDSFPAPPLRPQEPLATARMRVLSCFTDTHLGPALAPLFRALLLSDTGVDTGRQMDIVRNELDKLDRWLAADVPLSQRSLHLGDLVLAPTFWYVLALAQQFGAADIAGGFERVQSWWTQVNEDPEVSRAMGEMDTAFRAFTDTLQKPVP